MSCLALGVCLAACNQYLLVLLPEHWYHLLPEQDHLNAMVVMKQIFVCVMMSMEAIQHEKQHTQVALQLPCSCQQAMCHAQ